VNSRAFAAKCNDILLSNPLLKGNQLMMLRQKVGEGTARRVMANGLGYPNNNWTTSHAIGSPDKGWNNERAVMKEVGNFNSMQTIYKPKNPVVINDPDLHWDGERIMFSSVNDKKAWHLFEVKTDGSDLKQLTPDGYEDIGFFDGCYMPNGKVAMVSTAPYQGVPCIAGGSSTGAVYELNPEDKKIRQLNFGQDNDWNPVVLNNGRLMYLRWEYTDASHYFTRILMHMNPDGTGKKEYYGSNSYFPNSMFETRPVPNHPTKFITVVSGHHGVTRSGRLMLFDPQKGRHEADGVVQEIPFKNRKVEPIIKDRLVDGVWPQFLSPYPLDDHFFLVTAKPSKDALWGIYLVDVFDNMTLIAEQEGEALMYPMLLNKRPVPPVIPDKVRLADTTSTVYIANIYEGQGLKGVKKGSVKALRVFAYEFSYNRTGGHDELGIQSSWDVKRVLGTVPVEKDGSAIFKIPANTPISLQPLDENGRAMQLMRSWLTGMPGEVVSCVGCHESQNTLPKVRPTIASRKLPDTIQPFYGGVRPFAFKNEIQPLLDRKCTSCHNSTSGLVDFSDKKESGYRDLSGAYRALHPFVRRPGPESDLHVLTPMDFHATTSELVQILEKGHHGVKLNKEEWDRINTWIDLNVPYHGQFSPPKYCELDQKERRSELAEEFHGYKVNTVEEMKLANYLRSLQDTVPQKPARKRRTAKKEMKVAGWPMSMEQAIAKQKEMGEFKRSVKLDNGLSIDMVKIPAGRFVTTNHKGEQVVKEVEKAFWISQHELTNEQYTKFFPQHDSRYVAQFWKDHTSKGYPINYPEQPVSRVSWDEANAFCQKLSEKSGKKFSLPTEAQWEWAGRAGSADAFWFGNTQSDFTTFANMADDKLADFAVIGVDPKPMGKNHGLFPYYGFIPRSKLDDGNMIVANPGSYKANAWGLYDVHGNVAEWMADDFNADIPAKEVLNTEGRKMVKGGSWRDRPKRSKISNSIGYYPWQKVMNVGFRIVMEE
jgi:formylglycine-generating enzyme required for sulfatase activity